MRIATMHGERVQLHGAGEDQRLEQVVLQLLVEHEEHQDDDARGDRVQEAGEDRDGAADGRAHQRDQVGDPHEQRDQAGEGHPETSSTT